MRRRTPPAGALLGTAAAPAPAAAPGPSVTRTGSTALDSRAVFSVSHDGPVSDNAFRKNGLLTHKGHQHAARCTADRGAVVGRRALGANTWRTVRAGHAFPVRRTAVGTRRKTRIPVPLDSGRRTEPAPDRYGDARAVFPYGRIAAASAAFGHTDRKPLYDGAGPNASGEVVTDGTRVPQDGVLPVVYQEKPTGRTPSPLHVVDSGLPARP
ncbi:hypothetical protein [Streptomyces sp. YIM B13518]|uniref:hypothetical protein n=1 Tax=Streptomyces sp. YIM B13518 TaxID=3366316 RepID=UPI0036C541F1